MSAFSPPAILVSLHSRVKITKSETPQITNILFSAIATLDRCREKSGHRGEQNYSLYGGGVSKICVLTIALPTLVPRVALSSLTLAQKIEGLFTVFSTLRKSSQG